MSAQKKRTQEIDVHDSLPRSSRCVLRRRDQTHSGVVDENISSTIVLVHLLSEGLDKGFRGDIASHGMDLQPLGAQPSKLRIERLNIREDYAVSQMTQM